MWYSLFNGVNELKRKIIAIVIIVIITVGTATGIGIAVKQSNDRKMQELVSSAVSEALATSEKATTETTTKQTTSETTTENTTTKRGSTTVQRAAKETTQTTTTKVTTTVTTTTTTTKATAPSVTQGGSVVETIKSEEGRGYKKAIINGEIIEIYIVIGNGPNAGRYFYDDKNNKRIYIDNIDELEFID